MDHGLEIIPISSYRRSSPNGPRAHVALVEERKGAGWGVALVMGWMLLIVAIMAHSWLQSIVSIRGMPPAERTRIYESALGDTVATCTTPQARAGAIHDHCLRQAEFLVLFPECNGGCQKLAQTILPHARR